MDELFRVKPEELRRTSLSALYLFTAVGAFIVSRITRSVLFLEIPDYKAQLPLTYMGVALTVSCVMFFYARVERHLRRDITNAITLALLIAVTIAFRGALATGSHTIYWAYYIWVEVFGAFLIVQFWTFTNEIFHARQAKRLFAIIGGGGVLSNIAFGFLLRRFTNVIGTEDFLYVIVACLCVSLFAVWSLGKDCRGELTAAHRRRPNKRIVDATKVLKPSAVPSSANQRVFGTKHVRLIGGVVVLTYLVSTFVDYQWQVIIGDTIAEKGARGAYFGTFFLLTGIIGGAIQFFATSRLLERFGVLPTLLLLPCFMLTGSLSVIIAPMLGVFSGLWAASITKGSENVLRYTVNDSTLQLMYLPVPTHLRGRAKAFIDGILKQGSIGLGGLVLWGVFGRDGEIAQLLSITVYSLSYVIAAVLVLWIIVITSLRQEYINSLVHTLQHRRLNFDDQSFEINDDATINSLGLALESKDLGEVLHALDLLDSLSPKAIPQLAERIVKLLNHEVEDVRVVTLDFIAAHTELGDIEKVAELQQDGSPRVRAAAVITCCAVTEEAGVVLAQELLDDTDATVRAAAIIGLIRYCGIEGMFACLDRLKAMLKSDEPSARQSAAWILGKVGVTQFHQPLVPLLIDPSEKVCLAAIVAAGILKSEKLVPQLVSHLDHPVFGRAVVDALVSYKATIEPTMVEVVEDTGCPPYMRKRACIVLGRLRSDLGVEILCRHLEDENLLVRHAAVNALCTIARHRPEAGLDPNAVEQALNSEGKRWFSLLAIGIDLTGQTSAALLIDALDHRRQIAQQQILQLLSLKYPAAPINLVARNLRSSQRTIRANAVEVLDNLINKTEKSFVLPILEGGAPDQVLSIGAEVFGVTRAPLLGTLRGFLSGPDPWLAACAAFYVGKEKLQELNTDVVALLRRPTAICRETAMMALHNLEPQGTWEKDLDDLCSDRSLHVQLYARNLVKARALNRPA